MASKYHLPTVYQTCTPTHTHTHTPGLHVAAAPRSRVPRARRKTPASASWSAASPSRSACCGGSPGAPRCCADSHPLSPGTGRGKNKAPCLKLLPYGKFPLSLFFVLLLVSFVLNGFYHCSHAFSVPNEIRSLK